ncbi:MAG: CooT family nickel-binding protein [Candidatus Bathyarchaeota archaeon]|nr:CooT family nickel-binding protein [Candidatus Bathyarchaeota archaeon]
MCEFKVFLDGEKVAEDIIYARVEGKRVTVRDILGKPVVLEGAKIEEIDVMSTRLVLTRTD